MYCSHKIKIFIMLVTAIMYVVLSKFLISITLSRGGCRAVSFSLLISSELFSWGGQINLASKDKSVNRQVLSSTAIYIFLYYALRSFYDNVFKAIFMLRKLSNFVKNLDVYKMYKSTNLLSCCLHGFTKRRNFYFTRKFSRISNQNSDQNSWRNTKLSAVFATF